MAPIPRGGTVAVTGAAGFIGGWVTRQLLDKGYRVRACVRDADDANKTDFLRAMPGYLSGRLSIHSANLDEAGCFDEIFSGCHGVAHLSHVSGYDDQDYIKGVCDHIIASIGKASTVTRVVVTSSIAAVVSEGNFKEMVRRPVIYEDRYAQDNPRLTGYSKGKNLAERAFSDAAESSDGEWDAITCCPGDNVGPIQSAHQKEKGPWQHLIELMLLGECNPSVHGYRPWHTVDVRDTATCHIGLLESVEVRNGERYISVSTEKADIETICRSIDRLLPELGYATPDLTEDLDDEAKARREFRRGVYWGTDLRNDRIRTVVPITFRPLDESVRDCVESMLAVAKIEPVLRPGYSRRKD